MKGEEEKKDKEGSWRRKETGGGLDWTGTRAVTAEKILDFAVKRWQS